MIMEQTQQTNGYTLIECIITCGMIGIVITLIIAAVKVVPLIYRILEKAAA